MMTVNYRLLTGLLTATATMVSYAWGIDIYQLDPSHTTVGFTISHLVISEVEGRFKEISGTVSVDPRATNAVLSAQATIQTKSIDTDVEKRDEHLRNPDFFNVEKYPTIIFEGKRVEKQGNEQVMIGTFTMHGISKEIRLPFTTKGPIKDPWGKTRMGIKAKTSLNRKDYGLTWNQVLETGGLAVGEEVQIEINAEAVKEEATKN